jgi:hypothetical protein
MLMRNLACLLRLRELLCNPQSYAAQPFGETVLRLFPMATSTVPPMALFSANAILMAVIHKPNAMGDRNVEQQTESGAWQATKQHIGASDR